MEVTEYKIPKVSDKEYTTYVIIFRIALAAIAFFYRNIWFIYTPMFILFILTVVFLNKHKNSSYSLLISEEDVTEKFNLRIKKIEYQDIKYVEVSNKNLFNIVSNSGISIYISDKYDNFEEITARIFTKIKKVRTEVKGNPKLIKEYFDNAYQYTKKQKLKSKLK